MTNSQPRGSVTAVLEDLRGVVAAAHRTFDVLTRWTAEARIRP